ncbi:MAG TPA: HAD family hydrolase [Candidatus Limnocylindria bacterium]|nr:HAD family hydrolase [Candidatus Limnocylindria bacterium]
MNGRWVCLDVGETLIDESRIWGTWADELRIPRLTFFAALGAVIERGLDHRAVFELFGVDDWPMRVEAVESVHGGFQPEDLYPDALPALVALRERGYAIAITANQPAIRDEQLRALGVVVEVMAMSDAMGVAKPDPAFFSRTLELMGSPEPSQVAYVGDRVDNDVLPSSEAGMRAIWIRRGPWGVIQTPPPAGVAALAVDSLAELVHQVDEAWPDSGGPHPPAAHDEEAPT